MCGDRLLAASTYTALITVGIVGMHQAHRLGQPWPVAPLLLFSFGVLAACSPDATPDGQLTVPLWQAHLFLGVHAAVATVLAVVFQRGGSLYLILLFMVCARAMLLSPRIGATWMVILIGLTAIAVVAAYGRDGLIIVLSMSAGYLFLGIFATALRRANAARYESERLLIELQAAHRQLQDHSARAERLAVSEERNRLAREMRDSLGHRLTVAAVQLEGAQRLASADPARAERMLLTVRGEVRHALADLRGTVATLRLPLETDLRLASALQRLADQFHEATGTAVEVTLDDLPPLSAAQRHTIYHAVQEGLTNVQKHAQATSARTSITSGDGIVTAVVEDNGVGPAQAGTEGFGLAGLRERAPYLGGSVTLSAGQTGGASLSVCLPLVVEATDA